VLSVENIEVVYHSVVAVLRGVSLTVPEKSIVCLLGPNGAGKTSVLRALTGLLDIHDGRVTKGRVRYRDQDLLRQSPDAIVRAGVAQVMEGRRILAELSVEDNLRAGGHARSRAETAENLAAFFEKFPVLGERRREQAGYLSGGEQQMLAIARALMARPSLLLLDEPSLGLAPKAVAVVASLIREVHSQGVSVLLVEQNANLALSLADHGYVMENGRIVLDGPAHVLRADEDMQEFYLGGSPGKHRDYKDVKHYRRRKRWLS
jgi:branched-chain amino acid transport system ATP-binding protein